MAVDTQNKRRAAWATLLLVVYPVADGTIAAADREQALWIYSGITVGAPPAPSLAVPGSVVLESADVGTATKNSEMGSVDQEDKGGSIDLDVE